VFSNTAATKSSNVCVLKCCALMPSSAEGVCVQEIQLNNEHIFWSFTVDKLQFEPPLRKETEAHSEMVTVIFLINTSMYFGLKSIHLKCRETLIYKKAV